MQTGAHELRSVPGNVVIGLRQIWARRVSQPFLRKERDNVADSRRCTMAARVPRHGREKRRRRLDAVSDRQMTELCRAGIHFDEIRVSRASLEHEIEADEAREPERGD